MLENPNNRGSDRKANGMEGRSAQEDQNQRRAVVAGFHHDTTEQQVQDILKENLTTIRMSTDQIQIKCPAKPITHAFLQFTDNDERDKFVRSENILKKELRGRKIRIHRSWMQKKDFVKQDLDTSNAAFTQDTMYHSCRSK